LTGGFGGGVRSGVGSRAVFDERLLVGFIMSFFVVWTRAFVWLLRPETITHPEHQRFLRAIAFRDAPFVLGSSTAKMDFFIRKRLPTRFLCGRINNRRERNRIDANLKTALVRQYFSLAIKAIKPGACLTALTF
jgi:hypothetical protein